jgi:beta-phosphoglucomutase
MISGPAVLAVFHAVFVDYNGVLVDDELVHLAAFRDVLGPMGLEISESAYWERYLGYDDDGAFRAILRDAGRPAPDELIHSLIEAKRPVYQSRARTGLQTFAGAAGVLRLLHTLGPLAIVSGALRDEIELGLNVLGVRELVGQIVSAEDTRRGKPDPEGYLLALDWARTQRGHDLALDALVLEDSLSGIEAAKDAGLTCLAVAHSYESEELRAAGADEVVAAIGDVTLPVLGELYRRKHAG